MEADKIRVVHAQLFSEVYQLLLDLKRCGNFYNSAIEIDMNISNGIDGEEFEKRIDKLLKRLEEEEIDTSIANSRIVDALLKRMKSDTKKKK